MDQATEAETADVPPHLADNLARVRERLAAALRRAGRDPSAATLVAVTKTVSAATVRALYGLGVRDFGENRVAAGVAKAAACAFPEDGPDAARWHLIGHLQRNKADEALGTFRRIHSVESLKLVEALARAAEKRGMADVEVWLEVNVSGEESKYGVAPSDLPALFEAVAAAPRLRCRGLMTMAPFTEDPETARPVFRALRALRDRLPGGEALGLSMGMSGDFEVAAEEGATLVRVGSALYE